MNRMVNTDAFLFTPMQRDCGRSGVMEKVGQNQNEQEDYHGECDD